VRGTTGGKPQGAPFEKRRKDTGRGGKKKSSGEREAGKLLRKKWAKPNSEGKKVEKGLSQMVFGVRLGCGRGKWIDLAA